MLPETSSLFYTQNGSINDLSNAYGLNLIHRRSDTPDIIITGDANGNDITDAGGITDIFATSLGSLADNSRIFNINAASATTTLAGLTLTGGHTNANGTPYSSDSAYGGGAIRSLARLNIHDTTIDGNGTSGDYSYGSGVFANQVTYVNNSQINKNLTRGYSSVVGGIGIYSSLTICNSTTSNGGGVATYSTFTIANSTINNNATTGYVSAGGGILVYSTVNLTNSTLSGNSTAGDFAIGGGIFSQRANITNSTVSSNSTSGSFAFGGGISTNVSATVKNSIILGNYSDAGTFGSGLAEDELIVSTTNVGMVPATFIGFNVVGHNSAAYNASGSANVVNASAVLPIFSKTPKLHASTPIEMEFRTLLRASSVANSRTMAEPFRPSR